MATKESYNIDAAIAARRRAGLARRIARAINLLVHAGYTVVPPKPATTTMLIEGCDLPIEVDS